MAEDKSTGHWIIRGSLLTVSKNPLFVCKEPKNAEARKDENVGGFDASLLLLYWLLSFGS